MGLLELYEKSRKRARAQGWTWPLLSETAELNAQWEWLTAVALATGVKPVMATRYNDRSGS
jgi:hypothetical protein